MGDVYTAPTPAQSHPSVLCADNSPGILEICKTILQADGYQVFTVGTGAAALEFLKLHTVNVAIIDDSMSDIEGIELARQIKLRDNAAIVVMFCNNLLEYEKIPSVDAFLSKGNGPIALRKLIATLLQR